MTYAQAFTQIGAFILFMSGLLAIVFTVAYIGARLFPKVD